jgi:thiazole synthase
MSTATDVLIIGGGIVGLAIAVELRLRGATVTVLSRDFQQAAAHAAAGMLAPQAEAIASAPMRSLCLQSRDLYPEWVRKLETISGQSTGYWSCGILAPMYDLESNSLPPSDAQWLDRNAIHYAQSGLSPEVVGGWWFPEDGQVDNRLLVGVLRSIAQTLGVEIQEGGSVESIQQQQGRVVSVKTAERDWQAEHYVMATGAWLQDLLPLPVQPKKGQMLSLQVPHPQQGLPLQRVLFGNEVYIVPRRDGRIIIGATSEAIGFTPYNTAKGIQTLLNRAIRLYPTLEEFSLLECWWGFRPATPDELPILGTSPCKNLTLATGHYRNGILLAPITAKLIADLIWNQQTDSLLPSFSWQRFCTPLSTTTPSTQPAFVRMLPQPSLISTEPDVQTLDLTAQPLQPAASFEQPLTEQPLVDRPLTIAGRTFQSRLMTGTGKYRTFDQMRQSIAASGSQIVTVAVRRVQTQAPGHEGLAEALDWTNLWMLPNTAGCQTAEEAVRVARLGREMAKLLGQEDNNFVKLEVIPDAKYLLPDPIGTLQAAEQLVKEGFAVLPYINADPLLAKHLEEAGCVTVMPLGSPIGSGQGIRNAANIEIIIENARVPVVVDAGIGTPSEAAQAMEMGADALLINTAIAQAKNPMMMGQAMGMAAQAGRLAYLAGRIPVKTYASPSSPTTGTVHS